MNSRRLVSLIALTAGLTGRAFIRDGVGIVASRRRRSAPRFCAATQQQRPNVLIWLMDDVGFGQLSSFGGLVDTPNIDRVARMGVS